PEAEDDLSLYQDPDWRVPLTLRDAKTGKPLSEEERENLGIPEDYLKISPNRRYHVGKLRLIFRTKGFKHVRFANITGADATTEAVVTYNLDDLNDEPPMHETIGEWTRLDCALVTWHDIPMKIGVEILTGEPQYADLQQKIGAEQVFGDKLRLQWLATVEGKVDREYNLQNFTADIPLPEDQAADLETRLGIGGGDYNSKGPAIWIQVEQDEEDSDWASTLFRTNTYNYLNKHCGRITENGSINWEWSSEGSVTDLWRVFSAKRTEEKDQPVKLVFMPYVTELEFELPGLPDAPNPRSVDDLFEINIPRLTFGLDQSINSAEDDLVYLLCVATQTTWEHENIWDEVDVQNIPPDHTFLNITPQKLIDWYAKNTPGSKMKFDEADKVLYVNKDSDRRWDKIVEWLQEKWEDLTYRFLP
ncbi:MAG: hypothetical protein AAF226_15780, partial [Verrucomicrobiota bacterium]